VNIGIIIHSQSGHTAKMATAIAERFRKAGHETSVICLMTTGLIKPNSRRFTICNIPEQEEIDSFDAILFGGPVWSFSLSPVIRKCLGSLIGMEQKKTLGFVTHSLPKFFGANNAVRAMSRILAAAGAETLPGEALSYFLGFNKKKLAETIERIFASVTA
jgi:multimeric flavodoxin WrbA